MVSILDKKRQLAAARRTQGSAGCVRVLVVVRMGSLLEKTGSGKPAISVGSLIVDPVRELGKPTIYLQTRVTIRVGRRCIETKNQVFSPDDDAITLVGELA